MHDGHADGSVADWEGLRAPVRRSLELAWAAYAAGSIPVGCVVTDPGGAVVAEARNRAFDRSSPGEQISGSYIAHAEINALADLPPGEYADHTLWTSLEPCFLCSAAIVHSHVGSVVFVATDPLMTGTDRLPELNLWVASRWPKRSGPVPGSASLFSGVLHVAFFVGHQPGGVVTTAYGGRDPALVRAATRARDLGLLDPQLAAREAFAGICDEVGREAGPE